VRVSTLVGLTAAGVAAAVVGITAATANHPPKPLAPREGKPPFAADWTAPRPLTRSVEGAVGSVPRLRAIARANPSSAFVRLNLGLALYWQRDEAGALSAWKEAKRAQPDTPSAVRAGDLLHPSAPPGLPRFVPSFRVARTPVQRKILEGVQLQRSGRPVSARRAFAAALRLAPDDRDARVAAAVALYDKDRPSAAFGRLGPLVRRFPHAQTVRFHLGLLSIWLGAFGQAREELRLAVAESRRTSLAREADVLLKSLENVRTK